MLEKETVKIILTVITNNYSMKAKFKHPRLKEFFDVEILKFINDGYAIIKHQDGWLGKTLVNNLRIDGDQDDRKS